MVLIFRYRRAKYLYRSIRTENGVRNVYIAAGSEAERMAEADASLRAQIRELKDLEDAELDLWREADAELKGCFRQVHDVQNLIMLASGWHQHEGTWRPRRMSQLTADDATVSTATERLSGALSIRSDLTALIEQSLIKRLAGGNDSLRAELFQRMMALKIELAGPKASPAVRLLASDAALCWLAARESDWMYERMSNLADNAMTNYFDKRRTFCHRRFLQSIKTLEQVRTTVLPRIDGTDLTAKIVALIREFGGSDAQAPDTQCGATATEEGAESAAEPQRRRRTVSAAKSQ